MISPIPPTARDQQAPATFRLSARGVPSALPTLFPALVLFLTFVAPSPAAPVLDHRQLLEAQTFWDNRDFDWFERNIPFLDTPDAELNTTYYYRWELVTKHLTYGSPETGYLWTEFIDRPFWSGAYGAISCPSGHHFYEARWLHDPRYSRDYACYWFRTPGAQPRRYSAWMADSVWATYLVHPNREFLADLLPDLEHNFEEWIRKSWVPEAGLFWQVGHDDGMEFNIASRQTMNILSGAPSYRPSFNSYMWADAQALARIAERTGQAGKAASYRTRANALKKQLQDKLWDPKREFFFPMFRDDEEDADGNRIAKNTLIYQSGKFAGSEHGREEAGYVPWSFNLPDPGYEAAWKFLMDPNYFHAPFGPTTVERHDPLFLLQKSCCWWSGQSWPFATTQTLKGLANLLHHYQQDHVTRADYYELLRIYALSQRKNGRPYIAEALHPDTGSWEGHDGHYHSEHYFHSGFVDLVITGLAGLLVEDSDTLTVNPLAPPMWDYFAMEEIPYRGHRLAIIWDKSGQRYNRGAGFQVLVDGEKLAASPNLQKLTLTMPPLREEPLDPHREVNYAVNNDGSWFPRFRSSHTGPNSSLAFLHDGNTAWYHLDPPIRWTSEGSPDEVSDWVELDLGIPRPLTHLKLFVLDDGDGQPIAAPHDIRLDAFDETTSRFVPVIGERRPKPAGHRPHTIRFPELTTQRLRVTFIHATGKRSGLTELEAWGPLTGPYTPAPPPAGNLAFNPKPGDGGFPKATASFHDRYGGIPARAHDGKIVYAATPMNRWTSYGSPNAESDWFALDFGARKKFGRVILHLYDDRGGVQAPRSYALEFWTGAAWQEIPQQHRDPETPIGSTANLVRFPPVESNQLRVVFTHLGKGDTRSGMTEIEVWEE